MISQNIIYVNIVFGLWLRMTLDILDSPKPVKLNPLLDLLENVAAIAMLLRTKVKQPHTDR
jgi:hypothetical protein